MIGPFERLVGAEPLTVAVGGRSTAARERRRADRQPQRFEARRRRTDSPRPPDPAGRGGRVARRRPVRYCCERRLDPALAGHRDRQDRRRARRLALDADVPARRAGADPPAGLADRAHACARTAARAAGCGPPPAPRRRSARRPARARRRRPRTRRRPRSACACPHHQCSVKRGPQFFSAYTTAPSQPEPVTRPPEQVRMPVLRQPRHDLRRPCPPEGAPRPLDPAPRSAVRAVRPPRGRHGGARDERRQGTAGAHAERRRTTPRPRARCADRTSPPARRPAQRSPTVPPHRGRPRTARSRRGPRRHPSAASSSPRSVCREPGASPRTAGRRRCGGTEESGVTARPG